MKSVSSINIKVMTVQDQVIDSVNLRRECDVKVGLTLSSGLDSNIIAYILSKNKSNVGLNTFTVSTENIDSYESEIANKVSAKYKFKHNDIKLKSDNFLHDLEETISYLGRPHSSYAITSANLMYKEISNSGVKVLIEGQGADERFGGYRIQRYLNYSGVT